MCSDMPSLDKGSLVLNWFLLRFLAFFDSGHIVC